MPVPFFFPERRLIQDPRSLLAGTPVTALDAMPVVVASTGDSDTNVISTSFRPYEDDDENHITETFMAPTSGKVMVIVGGGLRDNGGTNRIHLAYEIREVNQNGKRIVAPGISRNSWTNSAFQTSNYQYGCRITMVEDLRSGYVYFTRLYISVSGGSTADAFNGQLIVVPTS